MSADKKERQRETLKSLKYDESLIEEVLNDKSLKNLEEMIVAIDKKQEKVNEDKKIVEGEKNVFENSKSPKKVTIIDKSHKVDEGEIEKRNEDLRKVQRENQVKKQEDEQFLNNLRCKIKEAQKSASHQNLPEKEKKTENESEKKNEKNEKVVNLKFRNLKKGKIYEFSFEKNTTLKEMVSHLKNNECEGEILRGDTHKTLDTSQNGTIEELKLEEVKIFFIK